jgi:NADH-quinone oxidoreductase subunit H
MDIVAVLILVAKIVIVLAVSMGSVPFLVWFERRGSAWMQGRVGPNRVGPFGLLQSLADVLKFLFKENFVPQNANKFYYYLAPLIALVAPLAALTLIPFGSFVTIAGVDYPLQIAVVDTGILFILAFAGLEVYPIILAGWSSNNKYSILGSLRGSSQIISYEIAMGLALVSMIIAYGTISPQEMVSMQQADGGIGMWGALLNPLGALIFWICIFAETNRLPFDLPEGEAELVAGFHVEYGAMKFALFFLAEYVAMIMASALMVIIFFGGYGLLPGMSGLIPVLHNQFPTMEVQNIKAFLEFVSMFSKVAFMMFVFVWVRWTIPRFRYDQVMDLGWKVLFPLSLINLLYMALITAWKFS